MSEQTFARNKSSTQAVTKAERKAASSSLRIGERDDAFEREADHIAGEVMSAGALQHHWSLSRMDVNAPLQRKCSCGGSAGASGECEECKKKKEEGGQMVQRKVAGPSVGLGVAPPIVHEVLNSPGQPLDKATRNFFEPRFGHDLGNVRVHTDARAARSARQVGALAYTVGRDVVFGEGQHAPHTFVGHGLLAHELAHVMQQSGQPRSLLQRQTVGGPLDLKLDPCVTDLPIVGRVCGQDAAKVCSKMPSLPGCGAVCKAFDCEKSQEPKTVCPPGFHAAGSKAFAGQCCRGAVESTNDCCPRDRIAVGPIQSKCCKDDEVVKEGACVPSSAIPSGPMPCPPPGRPTLTGKCCLPPLVPGVTDCETPAPTQKPGGRAARPTGPVIINFVLDRPRPGEGTGALNSSLTSEGQAAMNGLISQLKANPTWKVQLVGRASPEGTSDYNMSLSARRARIVAGALDDGGIDDTRIADAPASSLPAGCESLSAGIKSCGEIGSKGEGDRQVAATPFAP